MSYNKVKTKEKSELEMGGHIDLSGECQLKLHYSLVSLARSLFYFSEYSYIWSMMTIEANQYISGLVSKGETNVSFKLWSLPLC